MGLSESGRPGDLRVKLDGAAVLAGLGAAVLAGLGAALRFAPGARRDTPEEVARRSVMLIPAGEWFAVSAVGARAPISSGAPCRIQFHDGDGERLSESYDLGPCGERSGGFALSFQVPVAVTVEIAAGATSFGPAPAPTICGALVFLRGILARCVFLARGPGCGGEESLAAHADAVAIPIGQTLRFPEQIMAGAAPIKRLRALSFLDGHGHPLAPETPGPLVAIPSRAGAGNAKREKGGGVIRSDSQKDAFRSAGRTHVAGVAIKRPALAPFSGRANLAHTA